jgi:hypothetical protein
VISAWRAVFASRVYVRMSSSALSVADFIARWRAASSLAALDDYGTAALSFALGAIGPGAGSSSATGAGDAVGFCIAGGFCVFRSGRGCGTDAGETRRWG